MSKPKEPSSTAITTASRHTHAAAILLGALSLTAFAPRVDASPSSPSSADSPSADSPSALFAKAFRSRHCEQDEHFERCLHRYYSRELDSQWVRDVELLVEGSSELGWGCSGDIGDPVEIVRGRSVVVDGKEIVVKSLVWRPSHSSNTQYHPESARERRGVMRATVEGRRIVVGLQCVYDHDGALIQSSPGAGTLDRRSPGRGHVPHDVAWYDAARVADCGCGLDDLACIERCLPHEGTFVDQYWECRRPTPRAI